MMTDAPTFSWAASPPLTRAACNMTSFSRYRALAKAPTPTLSSLAHRPQSTCVCMRRD